MSQRIRVVSYRRIFRTDWRLTRVWDFDLTKLWPGGIPVKSALWVLGSLLVMWVLSRVPPFSLFLGPLPIWLKYGTIAMLVAFWSQQETPDGRTVHAYALARLRLGLRAPSPRERPWTHWDAALPVRWDGSGAELHRGRVHGPAKVTFVPRVVLSHKKGNLVARPSKSDDPNDALCVVVIKGDEWVEVYG